MEININLKKISQIDLKLEEYLVLNAIFVNPEINITNVSTFNILEILEKKGFIRLINNEIIINPTTRNLLSENYNQKIKEILEYFQELKKKHGIGSRPFNFNSNKDKISPRLAEGNTIEEIKMILDMKFDKWVGTEWQSYLRPSTIFNRTKFYNYLDELDQYQMEQSKDSDMYKLMKDNI